MKNYKLKITLTAALTFAVFINLNAQKLQGIATYQSGMNTKALKKYRVKMARMHPDMKKYYEEDPGISFHKSTEFELKFNLTESTWKEVERLSKSGSFNITSTTYKNTAEKRYLYDREIIDKPFLIADDLAPLKWKITKESKKIGDYTAYKATLKTVKAKRQIYGQAETFQVEAWYTPDIAVPHGPEQYWGLPGLIIQLDDGKITYLLTKVVLNPKKKVRIKKPGGGKKINEKQQQKELTKAEEKMDEMHKQEFLGEHDH